MLGARGRKACLAHPADAVRARVVEAALGFEQHVRSHQQAHGVGPPLVVDDGVVDQQRPLPFEVPVMQNATRHQHGGSGQQVAEEVAGEEAQLVGEAVLRDVILEDGPDLRQAEAEVGQRLSAFHAVARPPGIGSAFQPRLGQQSADQHYAPERQANHDGQDGGGRPIGIRQA